jgi:tetratricopeptide (TPR) repeat protein
MRPVSALAARNLGFGDAVLLWVLPTPAGSAQMTARPALALLLLLPACAPKRVNEAPVLESGDRVPAISATAGTPAEGGRNAAAESAARRGEGSAPVMAGATVEERAAATADLLLQEGDAYVASGQLDLALDRYDRAQILRPDDAVVEYRIATVLDKQLRPIEALVRYQRFLHELELEKIRARGEAYGHLAEAIAHARERVLILERQVR